MKCIATLLCSCWCVVFFWCHDYFLSFANAKAISSLRTLLIHSSSKVGAGGALMSSFEVLTFCGIDEIPFPFEEAMERLYSHCEIFTSTFVNIINEAFILELCHPSCSSQYFLKIPSTSSSEK